MWTWRCTLVFSKILLCPTPNKNTLSWVDKKVYCSRMLVSPERNSLAWVISAHGLQATFEETSYTDTMKCKQEIRQVKGLM